MKATSELSIGTRMSSVLIRASCRHFNKSECRKRLQKTLKLTGMGGKNFTFITYSSDTVGLQNFTEIQGGDVSYCADFDME
jgi:hypothetical protein